MIPVSHLSKLGIYDVEIGGVEVKARVINDGKVLSAALGELECDGEHPIVGLDVKECRSNFLGIRRRCALLVLSTRSNCLIIQLNLMRRKNRTIPEILSQFLSYESVCFVCPNGLVKRVRGLSFRYEAKIVGSERFVGYPTTYCTSFKCKEIGAVEVGQYAAGILKNPQLLKCKSLEKLGREAEVELTSGSSGGNVRLPKWDSEVFSEEEVKCVMHDAVACYRIVDKLLHVI